jgi:SNF2 family DNA or RNA helicase
MLDLRLSTLVGRIEIVANAELAEDLQVLRSGFASARSINRLAFDVDVDDLLVNLQELARWPDADFRWQPELLSLVEQNASDWRTVEAQLAGGPAISALVAGGPPSGTWRAPLNEFQQRDLARLGALAHGANFSVPGAGKTRVSLALFHTRREAGVAQRLLVVCPKSAFESWQYEAAVCFDGAPPQVRVMDGKIAPDCDILLINYERLSDALVALTQWLRAKPAMLLLDEAHRMKLGSAGTWGAACLSLAPYAATRVILSGTPAPNGARDLENLFSFVWPGQGRAAVQRAINGNDLRAASARLKPLFVRTTKDELKLPPVQTTVRRLDMTPLHRELYAALCGQLSGRWRGGEQDMEALGRVLMYLLMAATTPALLAVGSSRYEPLGFRIPPLQPPAGSSLAALLADLPHYELSPKYQEVAAIVAANAALGRKTLIWSTFVRNLTSLERLLANFAPAIVHGGSEDREAQLARFRQDPDCLVLLSNPATLGEGISLHQVCHDAVYLDRDFAAGRYLQSLDRIHRLGLADDVLTRVTVLVTNETIDELVEQRLARKLQFLGGVLDDPAVLQLGDLADEPSVSAGMDAADVRGLLEHLDGSLAI